MSIGYVLDTTGARQRRLEAQQNIGTIDEVVNPGFFAGTGDFFMSELAAAGRSVAIAGGAIPAAIDWVVGDDNLSGESLADKYFKAVDEPTKSAVEYWKPAPDATGLGGRVLGSVLGGLGQLAAGGGNPALMIMRQQIGGAADLVDQGVDATTAQMVGGAQGLAAAAGFRLGTYGSTLAKQMASGAAGNLATNIPAAAASEQLLEEGGYADQAKQFNPWDLEARAIDVLMGAAFGAVAHMGAKPADAQAKPADIPEVKLLPSEQAALLAANGAKNWAIDTAPGKPSGPADLAMHHNAMSTGLEQMMRNEPVNVAGKLEGANFVPREGAGFDIEGAMREEYGSAYDEAIAPVKPDAAVIDEGTKPVPVKPAEPAPKADGEIARTEPEEPEIMAARSAIERQPKEALIDIGDEQNPMLTNMRDAWKQVENEMQQVKKDANAFLAAVTCFLGG